MVEITGNTYLVRDKIRALGGKWDFVKKCWSVPDDKAAEAQRLVDSMRGRRACPKCGHLSDQPPVINSFLATLPLGTVSAPLLDAFRVEEMFGN